VRRMPFDWRGLVPILGVLALWQVLGPERSPFLPRPTEWWTGALSIIRKDDLAGAFLASLETIVSAMIFATLAGTAGGLLIGGSALARRMLTPSLEFIRAIPAAAMVPIGVLLFGYDGRMKTAIVVIGIVWPILLNVSAAVARIHPVLMDVAASLRMTRVARVVKILLPSIVPAILLGVRVALPLAVVITLVVEMLTSISGLGGLMIGAQRDYKAGQVFALLVMVGAIGLGLNLLLAWLEAHLMRYRTAPGQIHIAAGDAMTGGLLEADTE